MGSPTPISGECRLADWGVIRARGADAAAFLQGQLTNDVAGLDTGHARLAGLCSAKGRLQASFIVWKTSDDEVLLACARDLLASTLRRLSMFVLRARCKLEDAADLVLWGAVGAAAGARLDGAAVWARRDGATLATIRLPDGAGTLRALVVVTDDGSLTKLEDASSLSLDVWNWLAVRSGVVTIEAATVDRFVPQMVNFERVGGVDFKKGCYPGQEVVARSQYRGTAKRRTFLVECDALPASGQDVFASGSPGEPAGTIVNSAPDPDGRGGSALVELRLTVLDQGELRLGNPDGPRLRRVELPYHVLPEAESAP